MSTHYSKNASKLNVLKKNHTNNILRPLFLIVFVFVIGVISFPLSHHFQAQAACNTSADPSQGISSTSVTLPQTSTYFAWVQMKVANTTNDSVYLQSDNDCPILMGGGSITPGSWQWVNFTNGDTSQIASESLTGGSHTIKIIGNEAPLVAGGSIDGNTEPGLQVGRVILTADPSCVPTGTGDNCVPGSPPSVSISSLSANQHIQGKLFTISSSISPQGGATISKVDLLMGNQQIQTSVTSPYDFTLNTLSYPDGVHTISVRATDSSGQVGADSYTIYITNGDVNNDSVINYADISVIAANWQKHVSGATHGDINDDGVVDMLDISLLSANWGLSW